MKLRFVTDSKEHPIHSLNMSFVFCMIHREQMPMPAWKIEIISTSTIQLHQFTGEFMTTNTTSLGFYHNSPYGLFKIRHNSGKNTQRYHTTKRLIRYIHWLLKVFSFVVISRISGRCMMGNSYWYNNVMGKSNERVFWGTRNFGKYNRSSNTQLERLARATWKALHIKTEKITIFTKRRNKTSYRGLKSRCICEKLLWGSGRIYPYHPDPPHH